VLTQLQQRRDLRLRSATIPRERVQALAGLADEVLSQARDPTGDPRHLADLARFYDQLVRSDLLEHASALPAEERAAVLGPLVKQLERHESDASRHEASLLRKHAPAEAASLRVMAAAARNGNLRLRALL
jgi:hypothetical protein